LESLKQELEELKADRAKLLESSTVVTDNLRRGVRELQARLEVERADREEVETQLADLKQKSAAAGKDLPDAADLLNQLKAKRKKSKTDLADMEVILDILES
jgi:uncharacterized protein involved in exopolysaccharide biosynthesis